MIINFACLDRAKTFFPIIKLMKKYWIKFEKIAVRHRTKN